MTIYIATATATSACLADPSLTTDVLVSVRANTVQHARPFFTIYNTGTKRVVRDI